ncbi:MAG TPA: bifunctional demethylmenaquinone methyltransferase/2-methoxy-6-polyprenyl-1,4-benzoquinol methylase UbiE [Thermomicrobiales bacterium]|nr:bifunctional demethylmenaquinone methyltransferase/2-methoxy-6-polyprenyl-1,4-benzoquinol methylase UbiE [Thermomicrobiales bacterium]
MAGPETTNDKVPQSGAISSGPDIRRMFDKISPRYDLMNHVMTGGLDIHWRNMVAKQAAMLEDRPSQRALDVATGTGDLAFAIHDAGVPEVVGLDFSTEMIAKARKKARKRPHGVEFMVGDGMNLPFDDATFDACTISFGLRNMEDYTAAIREMSRILKPGGKFICLEMTPFRRPFLGPLFKFYFEVIVPLVGGVLSGDLKAYKYLPRSVRAFPSADGLADICRVAGLKDVQYQLLGFGAVAIHCGTRP